MQFSLASSGQLCVSSGWHLRLIYKLSLAKAVKMVAGFESYWMVGGWLGGLAREGKRAPVWPACCCCSWTLAERNQTGPKGSQWSSRHRLCRDLWDLKILFFIWYVKGGHSQPLLTTSPVSFAFPFYCNPIWRKRSVWRAQHRLRKKWCWCRTDTYWTTTKHLFWQLLAEYIYTVHNFFKQPRNLDVNLHEDSICQKSI